MTDREYVAFLNKCASIPHNDYSWLKDHCYRTLMRPCSPDIKNEHLAILELIKEHEERQWILVSERPPEIHQDVFLSLRSLDIKIGFRAETEPYYYADGCYIEPQNVIAWQPFLLEPYKVESEEENDT